MMGFLHVQNVVVKMRILKHSIIITRPVNHPILLHHPRQSALCLVPLNLMNRMCLLLTNAHAQALTVEKHLLKPVLCLDHHQRL